MHTITVIYGQALLPIQLTVLQHKGTVSCLHVTQRHDYMTAASRAMREREVSTKVWLIREAAEPGSCLPPAHCRSQQGVGLVVVHTSGSSKGQHIPGVFSLVLLYWKGERVRDQEM